MRMDQTTGMSAAEVLNTYPPGELVRILRAYGEEKQAKRIVSAIVREREKQPFSHSARLVELIRDSLPQAAKRTGGNPAKRTFQALRIEVNGELSVLERAIPAAVKSLAVGGRIAVLSYHSLEDRLVKQVFAAACRHHRPARTARRPRAVPAPAQAAHARCRTSHRGRDRREPAGRTGAMQGRRANQGVHRVKCVRRVSRVSEWGNRTHWRVSE